MPEVQNNDTAAAIRAAAAKRILMMDGAMGTMAQNLKLQEADFRGKRFANHAMPLTGNNDILSLTQPHLIEEIHSQFLEAGADIIETNSFTATAISQADYGTEADVYNINRAAAEIAAAAVARHLAKYPDKACWVAGALGPTNRTASLSPDVNDPAYRNVTFDALSDGYRQAAEGLADGGVDLFIIETVFDTLNAKAAIHGLLTLFEERGRKWPIMISGTITDRSGRTLSGQTIEAFWYSVRHAEPLSIGINCALGAAEMRPFLAELTRVADCLVSAYPNAGLPNAFGEYDETADETAAHLGEWASAGLVNILGGCCGTTPAHIRAIAEAAAAHAPRIIPSITPAMCLAGLEPFRLAS